MAKGKTNSPITMLVPPEWLMQEVFQQLIREGHTINPLPPECLGADVVFGVNCHMMTEEMLTQKGILTVALKAGRKRKKEKK